MKLGLVGYPQVGKKTLFKLLTGQEAQAAGLGLAPVHDARLEHLVTLYNPRKRTPATIEIALLPDLEEDSQKNADALKSLEQVDAICHLVRSFADESVYHLAGSVDSARDISRFAEELLFADMIFVDKRLERIARERKGQKEESREKDLLERMQSQLEAGQPLSKFDFSAEEEKLVASYPLLTRKPVVNILNTDEDAVQNGEQLETLQGEFAEAPFSWVAVSAKIEEELAELDEEEREAFLAELGLSEPALARLTRLCYSTLGLISFFTVGEDEVRAWTIRRGSLAPLAGRAIHTDIERGFIRAEIMRYRELAELGDEQAVKAAGKLQQKGRDYEVADGDIIHFLFKV